MPITELLSFNARTYQTETALVEINPELDSRQFRTWREYSLIEPSPREDYRHEISWEVIASVGEAGAWRSVITPFRKRTDCHADKVGSQ